MSKLVWSYGGGTQSAAIAVLILKGELPRPDVIVMADTSREVSETWDYLENVIRPAGFEVYIAPHGLARSDIYDVSGYLSLPAFTRQKGRIGKLPTFCSDKWKKHVVRRWLRQNNINDCDVWIGISTDELIRMKHSGLKWYRHVYPLITIRPTSRHQCISIVEQYGWPTPPKSRCWMCPNMPASAWKELKTKYPQDFQKAVELEETIRKPDPDIYLHSLAIPLPQAVEQSELQDDMFDGCDSGYCFT